MLAPSPRAREMTPPSQTAIVLPKQALFENCFPKSTRREQMHTTQLISLALPINKLQQRFCPRSKCAHSSVVRHNLLVYAHAKQKIKCYFVNGWCVWVPPVVNAYHWKHLLNR